MDIEIGMKRERARKLAQDIMASDDVDITIYAKSNGPDDEEIILRLSNEDMERPEVDADEIYVDLTD